MKKTTIRPAFIDSLQEKKRKIFAQPKKIKLAFKKQIQRVQVKCERINVSVIKHKPTNANGMISSNPAC